MNINNDLSLLEKYRIPSMGAYSEPGSNLCKILRRLDVNHRLNNEDKSWIKSKGMFQFHSFVEKWEKTGKADFTPLNRKKKKDKSLDELQHFNFKYDLKIYKPNSLLHKIIKRIDMGKRFSKKDTLWLYSRGFLKDRLKVEYHRREAKYYLSCYSLKKDIWDLINASSHLRKSHQSKKALFETSKVKISKIKKVKSALSVTRGGAYRDLKELDEALKFAQKAYDFEPTSFHPCTLFGAVYFEMGKYDLGTKWFNKAEENGADIDGIDSEIKSIIKNANGKKIEELKQHLLKIDSERYHWASKRRHYQ